MEKLKPKLFSVMKTYTKQQFVKDVIAGIIVAIIALPLSIALALASGVGPEQGIYTAIIAGFLISFFGGSRVQIAGPTAAFATIVAGIVAQKGMDGLILATILAGIILVVMGLLRLGNLIKYIPFTITTGFTAGIAVTIVIGQIKDFLGLTYPEGTVTIETMEKMEAIIKNMSTINWQALVVGLVCLAILIAWPYINKTIPGSLIAVIVGILMVKLLNMNVNTIGDLYEISNKLPDFHFPKFTMADISGILPDAFTIAILAAIESLLSCVVADSMINSKPFQHGADRTGYRQYRFGVVWRYPGDRRDCENCCQHQERRAHTDCGHGACGHTRADSGGADALCGADSDAVYRRDFVHGRLQYVWLEDVCQSLQVIAEERYHCACHDLCTDCRL